MSDGILNGSFEGDECDMTILQGSSHLVSDKACNENCDLMLSEEFCASGSSSSSFIPIGIFQFLRKLPFLVKEKQPTAAGGFFSNLGIDGLFVGPGDLGLRIRRTSTDLSLDSAVQRVADAARRHGKAWGQPAGSAEQVKVLHDQGAQLIAYGGEFITLMKMLERNASQLAEVYGETE